MRCLWLQEPANDAVPPRANGRLPRVRGREAEFEAFLHRLYAEGKLLNRSHIIEGLEALKLLLTGQNEGTLMVRASPL
jgi:hypothetical protein